MEEKHMGVNKEQENPELKDVNLLKLDLGGVDSL